MILARIQRLKDAPRHLLELASVIGREFHRRLVDHLAESAEASEQSLRELKTVELIYEWSGAGGGRAAREGSARRRMRLGP